MFIESVKNSGKAPFAITCESYEKYLAGDCFTCGADDHYCIKFGYASHESYQGLYASRDLRSSEALSAYMLTLGQKPYISMRLRLITKSFKTKNYFKRESIQDNC